MSYKGHYYPKNPTKYKGDPNKIVYRSLWERKVMLWLDENPNVLEWWSECLAIPYYDPIKKKTRRYFPDFWVHVKNKKNEEKQFILEVKPRKYSVKPRTKTQFNTKSAYRNYIIKVANYYNNQMKWQAAREYCKKNGMEFQVLTEHDLGIFK